MTGPAFKYQWSKRTDPLHTISLNGADTLDEALEMTSVWRRDLRVRTPWRIVAGEGVAAGETLAYGEGGSSVIAFTDLGRLGRRPAAAPPEHASPSREIWRSADGYIRLRWQRESKVAPVVLLMGDGAEALAYGLSAAQVTLLRLALAIAEREIEVAS